MVRKAPGRLRSVVRRQSPEEPAIPIRESCLACDASLLASQSYDDLRVCPVCRFHYSLTARERIESLADAGSFRETNRSIVSLDPLSFSSRGSYKQRIFRDQRRTGLTEAVVTGSCAIGGSPVMMIALDFGFMGGTMGCVVGEKVALAFEGAAKRKLPAVAVVTSGGIRLQEGVLSLMQMAKTSMAARRLEEKGLPFISVLANPATGQAYASFANLADIVIAEPGAIVGVSPLRVMRETSEGPLPRGSHMAESHLEHGMLDAVVDRAQLRTTLAVLLEVVGPQYKLTAKERERTTPIEPQRREAWSSVQLARHESRPTSLDYIERVLTNFIELHGDRTFGDDPAIVCGLGHLGGQTVVVVGQERGRGRKSLEHRDGRTSPEGFRKAQRAIRIASKFQLPLITLIDTPGPDPSLDAEERGMGHTIATTMSAMAGLDVPSISVVIGEGGSGGALGLGVADRVLMMENAIYSVISPEEAAELIYQDEARADEAAESLRLTAEDCRELGIVDLIVPEPPGGAHTQPDEAARLLRRILLQEMVDLQSLAMRRVLRLRYKKFRNIGEYGSHFRAAITREVNGLQGLVATGVRRIARRRRSDPVDEQEDILSHLSHRPASDTEAND